MWVCGSIRPPVLTHTHLAMGILILGAPKKWALHWALHGRFFRWKEWHVGKLKLRTHTHNNYAVCICVYIYCIYIERVYIHIYVYNMCILHPLLCQFQQQSHLTQQTARFLLRTEARLVDVDGDGKGCTYQPWPCQFCFKNFKKGCFPNKKLETHERPLVFKWREVLGRTPVCRKHHDKSVKRGRNIPRTR